MKVLKSNKLKGEGGNSSKGFLAFWGGASSFFSTFFSSFLGCYFSFLGFYSYFYYSPLTEANQSFLTM